MKREGAEERRVEKQQMLMSEDLDQYVRPTSPALLSQEGHHHLSLLQVRLGLDRDRDRERDRDRLKCG